ncbi:MAG: hypothetical protein LBF86_01355, partial [Helicobacteraceae bacterium]|nr:hypothetical protein [Helicobacteraceae bacterium]
MLAGCYGGGGNDDNKQKSPPSIVWQKSLGGSSADYANSIQQTSDNGYVIAGYSYSNDDDITDHRGYTGISDFWIVKLDENGDIEWKKTLGGSAGDVATSIQQTNDDGYIVAGYSASTDGDITGHHGSVGAADYWIVKLDKDGV